MVNDSLIFNKVLNTKDLHNRGICKTRHEIACLDPVFIVNPNLPELISKFGHYFFHGQHFYNRFRFLPLYKLDTRPFKVYLDHINLDNIDDHYVIDESTGECYPIFMAVPCGHCTLCKDKKVQSYVNRIKYESFMYTCKPIFTTLTYNNESLPRDGVSVRDCQLFLKRFRQRLVRAGFTDPIRYVLVSEYGTHTKRPHYHVIFFGIPVVSDADMRRVESLITLAWSNGFTLSRTIDMSSPSTAYYTCKYMRKDGECPSGKSATFCLSSRGHGGIGSGFFRKQASLLFKKPRCEFNVLNPWTNKVESFQWSGYALDYIAPSVKKSVPLVLRKALAEFCLGYNVWRDCEPDTLWLLEDTMQKVKSKFSGILYLPFDSLSKFEIPLNLDLDLCMADAVCAMRVINKFINKNYDDVLQKDRNRQYLLSNFQVKNLSIDLVQKVSCIKRNVKRLEKLEKL